jgi:MarR family transcriptional regulator for hemolysin
MVSIMRCINVISRCAAQYRTNKLEGTGLNGHQYTYILNVCRHPGISQDGLARKIYINKSNVARQLTKLEENGYIERRPSAIDKRIIEVYPTDKAVEILPRVREVLRDWNNYITEGFTPEECELLTRLLETVMHRATDYVSSRDEESEI